MVYPSWNRINVGKKHHMAMFTTHDWEMKCDATKVSLFHHHLNLGDTRYKI